jgi:hypothetical protein
MSDTVTRRVHVRIIVFTPCNPNKEDHSQEYIDNSRGVVFPCMQLFLEVTVIASVVFLFLFIRIVKNLLRPVVCCE